MSTFDYESYEGGYQQRAIHSGHPVQSFWHRMRLEAALADLPTKHSDLLLDIGCGAGVFTFGFSDRVNRVCGVDISKRAIAFCRSYQQELRLMNCEFIELSGDTLPLDDGSVDVALMTEVIEHLSSDESRKILLEIHRVLRPGGHLYVTTPNYVSHWPLVEYVLDTLGLVPPLESEQHIQRFVQKSLVEQVENAGFELLRRTTFFVISPFFAPVSRRLAEAMFWLEKRHDRLPGMVLSALCTKL